MTNLRWAQRQQPGGPLLSIFPKREDVVVSESQARVPGHERRRKVCLVRTSMILFLCVLPPPRLMPLVFRAGRLVCWDLVRIQHTNGQCAKDHSTRTRQHGQSSIRPSIHPSMHASIHECIHCIHAWHNSSI